MNWTKYNYRAWINGMKNNSMMNFPYLAAVADTLSFCVMPHYTKKFTISNYSVWYQTADMRNTGGTNFAVKIKNCKSFEEGKNIAEKFYDDITNHRPVSMMNSQYLDSNIYINNPFIS